MSVIIFRYLSRDILVTTFAVCFALLLIFLSVRFVNLLADAAAGKYAVNVLFKIIAYRMPGFLQIILPLGFYVAILLTYGRLYMESEMVVLFACGMSQRQLIGITLVPALFVSVLVAVFTFWLGPVGSEQYAKILDQQRKRSEFETLSAGRFQPLGQGQIVTYVSDITNNHLRLNNVFIASDNNKSSQMVAVANYAEQVQREEYGQRYFVLHDGYRYEGQLGTSEFRVTRFKEYGQYMPPVVLAGDYTNETDAKPTVDLFNAQTNQLRTTLQWRISLPVMVLVVTLLAVSFSKTNPRQGRYLKMLPAILVFIFYFIFLTSVRGLMEHGKWPIMPGFWVVHLAFLGLGLLLLNWETLAHALRHSAKGKPSHA